MSVAWRRAMKPAERTWQTLVIIPCGKAKMWAKQPTLGSVPARDAYVGPPFKLNRQYAERFGDRWIILSAEYGFIWPGQLIRNYDVSFTDRRTSPISYAELRRQVQYRGLAHYARVVMLGGLAYRLAAIAAFPSDAKLEFPFAGMPIGKAMQATKRAIQRRRK